MAGMGGPRRRITGKTAVMAMSADVIQEQFQFLRGQQYVNEEWKNIEHGLQNQCAPFMDMVNVVYQMVSRMLRWRTKS